MLSFKINQIKYNNNLILKDVVFNAFAGEITTIIGPSGSGKTSILNSLISVNNEVTTYDFDGTNIAVMDIDERQRFILENISFVSQNHEFISDLKISDHIELINEITQQSDYHKNILEELKIEDLLNKYPNELSGGEKSRVSLYLAILKNTKIIILDEPTASLDEHHTQCVLNVLNQIKNNKIIIIATHDEKVIQFSDTLYSIMNKTLVPEKNNDHILSIGSYKNEKPNKLNLNKISKILNKTKEHEKKYQKIIMFITATMIGFSSFATGFNNVYKQANIEMMNQLSSTEILIYKPSGGYADQGISHSAEGNELVDKNELEQIKNIPHVDEVRSRVDIEMSNPFVLMVEDRNPKTRKKTYLLVLENQKKNIDKSMSLNDAPSLNSYYSDKDYSKEILKDFHKDNGIYLSRNLAEYLCEDIDDLNGFDLKFDIYIPVYNSIGKVWAETNNGDTFWPNVTSCKVEQITLPIAGILKTSNMGIRNSGNYAIYVENELIMQLIEKHKPDSSRTSYLIKSEDYQFSIDEKPSEDTILREIEEDIWTPKSFSVFVDDSTQIETVSNEIAYKGFNVSNEYMNIEAINQSVDKVQGLIKMSAYVLTALVSIIYIVIKLINIRNEMEINNYLNHLGISSHNRKKVNILRYTHNTIFTCTFSMILLALFILFFNAFHYGNTSFNISMLVIVIILSLIIELLIPLMIERKMMNDKTK